MNGPLQEVQHCAAAAPWTRQGSSQAELHITVPCLGTIAPKKVVGGWPPRSLLGLIKGLSRGTPRPAWEGGQDSAEAFQTHSKGPVMAIRSAQLEFRAGPMWVSQLFRLLEATHILGVE